MPGLAPLAAAILSLSAGATPPLSSQELLGKRLFNDPELSNPPGQSCAACHAPETGWTGPDSTINATSVVIPGAVHTRAGNRKPPTVAYAGTTPLLQPSPMGGGGGGCSCGGGGMGGGGGCNCGGGGMGGGGGCDCGSAGADGGCSCGMQRLTFIGGLFWDGRATGWEGGDPLAQQAKGPFLNSLEQHNPNAKLVCLAVKKSDYATLYEEVWGKGTLDCVKDVDGSYDRIARSLAAYQRSAEVNPFSSRFDDFWRNSKGKMPPVQMINGMNWTRFRGRGLDDMELMGLAVFNTKGKCSNCHLLKPGEGGTPPLLTDFGYHNLGTPKNPLNPFYSAPTSVNPARDGWIDPGLGGFLQTTAGLAEHDYSAQAPKNLGRHRTPTLRNVDKRPASDFVKAYGHNGHFKSLQDIVHFYNLRDTLPACGEGGIPGVDCFPAPEVAENINRMDMGNLGLAMNEGMALIKFLQTLSDQ